MTQPTVKAAPVLVFTGPEFELAEGQKICIPGFSLWKAAGLAHWARIGMTDATGALSPKAPESVIEEYLKDGIVTLPLDVGQKPGLCYGVPGLVGMSSHAPFLGLLDGYLCWHHYAGFNMVQPSMLQQAQPGMIGGIG